MCSSLKFVYTPTHIHAHTHICAMYWCWAGEQMTLRFSVRCTHEHHINARTHIHARRVSSSFRCCIVPIASLTLVILPHSLRLPAILNSRALPRSLETLRSRPGSNSGSYLPLDATHFLSCHTYVCVRTRGRVCLSVAMSVFVSFWKLTGEK